MWACTTAGNANEDTRTPDAATPSHVERVQAEAEEAEAKAASVAAVGKQSNRQLPPEACERICEPAPDRHVEPVPRLHHPVEPADGALASIAVTEPVSPVTPGALLSIDITEPVSPTMPVKSVTAQQVQFRMAMTSPD